MIKLQVDAIGCSHIQIGFVENGYCERARIYRVYTVVILGPYRVITN